MTFGRLLLRNLFYHWRGNSAVFLGVAVGSAVLTGALLVGDSLQGSLQELTLQRLGWVDQALVAGRFFREDLADQLPAKRISPAILLRGAASSGDAAAAHRAGRVTILGVDARFWPAHQAPAGEDFWQSDRAEVMLNAALAQKLHVGPGDTLTLHLQKLSAIPRETLLGRRDAADVVDEWTLKVREVLPDQGLGRFSLSPTQEVPRNAFVPLRVLQAKLGLWGELPTIAASTVALMGASLGQGPYLAATTLVPGRSLQGRVNALLAGGGSPALQHALRQKLTLEDWGLVLHAPQKRGYFALESRQLLLDVPVAEVAEDAAAEQGLRAAPTLVYLANSIADGKNEIPYSVVAALDPALKPPLGPFLPPGVDQLKDDEIVLADWKESPLRAEPGATITLTYFRPEEEGKLREETATFRLKGTIPLQGVANDPDLTPQFPGITDKLDIRQWEPPFPYDNRRVKPRDERYWKEYRTTPKAYITLEAGKKLWGSRFGQLTSIRLAPPAGKDLAAALADFRSRLLQHLRPEQGGLVFNAVRAQGLEASKGGTDFGGLFLGFSCFLIAAALLLVGLMFRLNLDRRAAEIGLLLATGFSRRKIRALLLAEGGLLAAAGSVLGCAGAVGYAWLLLGYLKTRWPKELQQSFLELHVLWPPWSFVIGFCASLLVSLLTIAWAVRILGRVSPRALLAGETADATEAGGPRPLRWSRWLAFGGAAGALACAVAGLFAQDQEMKAMSFFGSGALLLMAGLAAVWAWMRGHRQGKVAGPGGWALSRLGVRNSARHPVRSLLTAGLLASATFLIIAVESFHRDPGQDFSSREGGSGGFVFLAESDLPIYQDLNTPKGRDELNFSDAMQKALQGVTFYAFRLRSGDDASCLNLYQPRRPRILGVPPALIDRGGFRFQATLASSSAERQDPWRLLADHPPGGEIPVFGEANTVTWMLKGKLGGLLNVPNEQGQEVPVRVAGLLEDSVFQSGLLASQKDFLELYPHHEGYNFFLIDVQPPARREEVKTLLEKELAERGFEVTPTAERLASYLAVENTYLSTFQALGGLGLLLGALGLAVVLLRSVWERRGELALLRALGYRHGALGWLVFTENAFLLLLGLAVGAAAALLAVAPHLLSGVGEVPWPRLLALLGLVLVVGLAAGAAAVVATLRTPLLPALRRE